MDLPEGGGLSIGQLLASSGVGDYIPKVSDYVDISVFSRYYGYYLYANEYIEAITEQFEPEFTWHCLYPLDRHRISAIWYFFDPLFQLVAVTFLSFILVNSYRIILRKLDDFAKWREGVGKSI